MRNAYFIRLLKILLLKRFILIKYFNSRFFKKTFLIHTYVIRIINSQIHCQTCLRAQISVRIWYSILDSHFYLASSNTTQPLYYYTDLIPPVWISGEDRACMQPPKSPSTSDILQRQQQHCKATVNNKNKGVLLRIIPVFTCEFV